VLDYIKGGLAVNASRLVVYVFTLSE